MPGSDALSDLPEEMLNEIFSLLSLQQAAQAAGTSTTFRRLAKTCTADERARWLDVMRTGEPGLVSSEDLHVVKQFLLACAAGREFDEPPYMDEGLWRMWRTVHRSWLGLPRCCHPKIDGAVFRITRFTASSACGSYYFNSQTAGLYLHSAKKIGSAKEWYTDGHRESELWPNNVVGVWPAPCGAVFLLEVYPLLAADRRWGLGCVMAMVDELVASQTGKGALMDPGVTVLRVFVLEDYVALAKEWAASIPNVDVVRVIEGSTPWPSDENVKAMREAVKRSGRGRPAVCVFLSVPPGPSSASGAGIGCNYIPAFLPG